jgi:hypothetical protein
MIDPDADQSAPARGIAWGFAISLAFWVALLFIVHAFAG